MWTTVAFDLMYLSKSLSSPLMLAAVRNKPRTRDTNTITDKWAPQWVDSQRCSLTIVASQFLARNIFLDSCGRVSPCPVWIPINKFLIITSIHICRWQTWLYRTTRALSINNIVIKLRINFFPQYLSSKAKYNLFITLEVEFISLQIEPFSSCIRNVDIRSVIINPAETGIRQTNMKPLFIDVLIRSSNKGEI